MSNIQRPSYYDKRIDNLTSTQEILIISCFNVLNTKRMKLMH